MDNGQNPNQNLDPNLAHNNNQSQTQQVYGQIIEPTTGSSVFVEPDSRKTPDNGFPLGYGPNADIKRVEKPKKPPMKERLKHTFGHLSKKAKRNLIIGTILGVILIAGFTTYAITSGMFRTDYSGTYAAAKELRTSMQSLKSNASCDHVTEYVNSEYTTMQVYTGYIDACKEVGHGVTEDLVTALGDTAGVMRDEDLSKKFQVFKTALEAAKTGNADVDETLDTYSVWHQWVIAEANGNSSHNDWDWSEADLANAAKILTGSGVPEFVEYGKGWLDKKGTATKAYVAYYHSALNTLVDLSAARDALAAAEKDFNDYKTKNEPNILKIYPLQLVDTAKLYSVFSDLYDYIRTTYQNNYNYKVGGCKELVNSIICE